MANHAYTVECTSNYEGGSRQCADATGDLGHESNGPALKAPCDPKDRVVFTPHALVGAIYRGLLGRNPSVFELRDFRARWDRSGNLATVLQDLVQRRIPGVPFRSAVGPAKLRVAAGRWDGADACSDLYLGPGFYDPECGFVWAENSALMDAPKPVRIGLSCNYLGRNQSRRILVETASRRFTVTLEDCVTLKTIVVGGQRDRTIKFSADGSANADLEGNVDCRNLSFQLWFELGNQPEVEVPPSPGGSGAQIIAVYDSQKEFASLAPIVKGLVDYGLEAHLQSTAQAIEEWRIAPSPNAVFLVSSDTAYRLLHSAGCRGRFIYAEHGVSPLKRYTYWNHYRHYDLVLLPGTLWTERIARLLGDGCQEVRTVGYPKLTCNAPLPPGEKERLCAALGLDPSKPVVLFAPSWSGGDRECGIFNLAHISPGMNVFCIPHDGDKHFVDEFVAMGYRIVIPTGLESISDYYGLADLLISDISSTAVEFASLGRPVICIETPRIPDFDEKYRGADGRIQVPHTHYHWDFCPMVKPSDLESAINQQFKTNWTARDAEAIRAKVKPFVDCCGRDATRRSVSAILEFLATHTEGGQHD